MQTMNQSSLLFAAVAALLAAPAAAQDAGQIGITMGYPAAVGVLWQVSDRIGLRPEINWSRSSSESTTSLVAPVTPIPFVTTTTTSSDGWQIGTGISALFYLAKGEALRTYVSPRFTYARISSTTDVGIISTLSPATPLTTVNSTYGVSGSIGAQYALAKRFGVFGEAGIVYGRSSTANPQLSGTRSDSKSTNVGLRGGAGVILFFRS